MLDMATDTLKLLATNKLFANQVVAFRQVTIGAIGTAIVFIALAIVPLPLWAAAAIAGAAGGFAMPYLFKDIRFK